MINLLIRIYSFESNITIIKALKLPSIVRFGIKIIANFILPKYFRITTKDQRYKLLETNRDRKIIVSLTSFPARIDKVWLVIETLLRQSIKPDKIILWLSSEQFRSLNSLPEVLLSQQSRGLEITFVSEDLRSHKKYFYVFQSNPKDTVITVDDDVFYDTKTIENLINLNSQFPNCVCIQRGWQIERTLVENRVLPYRKWKFLKGLSGPAFNILQTGVGGVLYPPDCLSSLVLNKKLFTQYCPFADDIWLYFMGNINNIKVVKTDNDMAMIPILNRGDLSLTSINVGKDLNDKQFIETKSMLESEGFRINI